MYAYPKVLLKHYELLKKVIQDLIEISLPIVALHENLGIFNNNEILVHFPIIRYFLIKMHSYFMLMGLQNHPMGRGFFMLGIMNMSVLYGQSR